VTIKHPNSRLRVPSRRSPGAAPFRGSATPSRYGWAFRDGDHQASWLQGGAEHVAADEPSAQDDVLAAFSPDVLREPDEPPESEPDEDEPESLPDDPDELDDFSLDDPPPDPPPDPPESEPDPPDPPESEPPSLTAPTVLLRESVR